MVEQTGERAYEAEMHRLRGELLSDAYLLQVLPLVRERIDTLDAQQVGVGAGHPLQALFCHSPINARPTATICCSPPER